MNETKIILEQLAQMWGFERIDRATEPCQLPIEHVYEVCQPTCLFDDPELVASLATFQIQAMQTMAYWKRAFYKEQQRSLVGQTDCAVPLTLQERLSVEAGLPLLEILGVRRHRLIRTVALEVGRPLAIQ